MYVLSEKELCILLTTDAREFHADIEEYAKANTYTYYIVGSVWLNLAYDSYGVAPAENIRELMVSRGLIGAVKYCDSIAVELLGLVSGKKTDWEAIKEFILKCEINDPNDYPKLLSVLRFPKRLTVGAVPQLELDSIQKFVDANRSCRDFVAPDYLSHLLKEEVGEILQHWEIPTEIDISKCSFSSGSTTASKILASKVHELGQYLPNFGINILSDAEVNTAYGRGMVELAHHVPQSTRELWGMDYIRSVPKSYKAYRIVSPQRPIENFLSGMIWDSMNSAIKDDMRFAYLDQSRSKYAAFQASISQDYATLDLTQASDRIPLSLIAEIFPTKFVLLIPYITCRYFGLFDHTIRGGKVVHVPHEENGKVRHYIDYIGRYWMYGSMGSRTTYLVESVFFLAVAEAAADIMGLRSTRKPPIIVGDDMIVDSRLAQLTVDLLYKVNAVPSEDKSYLTGSYREACGAEYYYGVDTHTYYCPRKVLSTKANNRQVTAEALVDMQHHFYYSPHVRAFLTSEVRRLVPDMTSHLVDTECVDLWETFPRVVRKTRKLAFRVYLDKKGKITTDPEQTVSDTIKYLEVPPYIKEKLDAGLPLKDSHGDLHTAQEILDLLYKDTEGHMSLVNQVPPKMKIPDVAKDKEFLAWSYNQYLILGPSYNTELDRLLGVSVSRLSKKTHLDYHHFGAPTFKVTY